MGETKGFFDTIMEKVNTLVKEEEILFKKSKDIIDDEIKKEWIK